MPDTASRLRVISPAVAANLASAREVIDLVKALLPGCRQPNEGRCSDGRGQLSSFLAVVYLRRQPSGPCVSRNPMAGRLLRCPREPDLSTSFPEPDAQGFQDRFDRRRPRKSRVRRYPRPYPRARHRGGPMGPFRLADSCSRRTSHAPGITWRRRRQCQAHQTRWHSFGSTGYPRRAEAAGATQEESIQKRFIEQKFRYPEDDIASQLKDPRDRWDVPFSGNPNVRYEVQDESGQKLTDFPLRFDMQRTGLGQQLGR